MNGISQIFFLKIDNDQFSSITLQIYVNNKFYDNRSTNRKEVLCTLKEHQKSKSIIYFHKARGFLEFNPAK